MSPGVRTYVKEHLALFLFVCVLLTMGVVFGALLVGALSPEQKQDMSRFLSSYFHYIHQNGTMGNTLSFWDVYSQHMKWMLLIWLLGLSVIGLPFIWVLDFLKGVLLGFTIAYLAGELSWKGLLFALVSVAPQNIVLLPAIVITSVMGMSFTIFLYRHRLLSGDRSGSVMQQLVQYTSVVASLGILLAGVALFEVYASPLMMQRVSSMLISVLDEAASFL
ncbi:stage II sporulation protein M [Paenibacillus sp. y28]|uniref:stage II sporulation protein M n=1 Tax=Paenibacillus sp. y28 TaxID=3129110 RepID=UPI00301A54D7